MLLTVSIIACDEAFRISRTIFSVKEIADEIIIIDLGSRDNTKTIIEKNKNVKVFSFKNENNCNDLAEARNFALEKAQSQWILFLEPYEEIIDEGSQLRIILENSEKPAYYLPVVNLYKYPDKIEMPRLSLRLIKNNNKLLYSGRLYQDITSSILNINKNKSLKVMHLPIIDNRNNYKISVDINPLSLHYIEVDNQIDIEEKDFKYLKKGIEYYWQGNIYPSIYELKQGFELTEKKTGAVFVNNIIVILLEEQKYYSAEKWIELGLTIYPEKYIFAFWKFYFQFETGYYNTVIKYSQRLLEFNNIELDCKNKIYLIMGLTYKNLGKNEKAVYYFKKSIGTNYNNYALSNLILLIEENKELDIEKFIDLNEKTIFDVLEVYYQQKKYHKGLEYIKTITRENKRQDILTYWQGKFLLKLNSYNKAYKTFKKVLPSSYLFEKTLDLLWVTGLMLPEHVEPKSVVNQIKLLGNKYNYKVIDIINKLFYYQKNVYYQFDNLTTKVKFYKKCLYYLEFLIEFTDSEVIKYMLEIIKKMNINFYPGDVGVLFYKYEYYYPAYYYLKKDLEYGENREKLLMLADICFQIDENEESELYKKRASRLGYEPAAKNNLTLNEGF